MSDTTVHTAGERSIKTEKHSVSRDFQRFLDTAAIELNVFNGLIFDFSLLRCSCFMRHAVLLAVFSQAGLIMRSTKSRMSRNQLA